MFFSSGCSDGCTAKSHKNSVLSLFITTTPFTITFVITSVLFAFKVYPAIAGGSGKDEDDYYLPSDAPPALREAEARHAKWTRRQRIIVGAFAATIGLAVVLVELILCEISDTLSPAGRGFALRITVPSLLFLLIVVIPFLYIQSVIRSMGWSFTERNRKGRIPKMPYILQCAGIAGWLAMFWWLGQVPGSPATSAIASAKSAAQSAAPILGATLSRVGVIGIFLMALLSGFASVSSPFSTFRRQRDVRETDIARKQAGLDAAHEMLSAKRSRLRALQRKGSDAPPERMINKVLGSIRGGGTAQEMKVLQLEISGLETMAQTLDANLSILKTRFAAQERAKTPLGRALVLPNYVFAAYCVYRIVATLITTIRRYSMPTAAFSTADPINRVLGLVARHWDPTLDTAFYARQISFLLSGVMLLLSASAVWQTLHLISRFTPKVMAQAHANLPLIVAQIGGIYVISSALLLRSSLPSEVGRSVAGALGEGLEVAFVERWFEGWFLVGGALTAVGIWLGRTFGGGDGGLDWDDYGGDVEMGMKRT